MKNFYFFILLCILIRFIFAFITKIINKKYLPLLSIPTFIISIVFLYEFFNYSDIKFNKGFFGNKVWWNNNRVIHSINYLLFSILAFNKNNNAWLFLFIDAIFGTIFLITKYLPQI